MKIELKEEQLQKIQYQTRKMFLDDFDIELSDLESSEVVNFFIEEMGGHIYNRAVHDIKLFIQDKFMDLEGEVFIPDKK